MPTEAYRDWADQGLRPHMDPNWALTEATKLNPGTYVAGQVLGRWTTLTAADDVQTLTVTGTPTGGSLTMSFDGITFTVPYNAAAAAVQALLDAHPSIGTGQSVVTGGPLPGTPIVVTFSGSLKTGLYQPDFAIVSNALTGGASPAGAWVHTTPGRSAGGRMAAYDDTKSDGREIARALLIRGCTVDTFGNHLFYGTGTGSGTSLTADVWIRGYFRTADLTGIDAAAVADLGRLVEGTTGTLSSTGTILAMV